jgi:demethylmenaquinone methyltransferase / 2-methoxy-6-polyprenyl-1,4-benzoquinol methylase
MSRRRRATTTLFAGIASEYSWVGAVMSLGQDGRWRRTLVSRVSAPPGSLTLDVASGTGLVSRELAARKRLRVVSLDPSEPMLRAGLPANELAGLSAQIRPVLGRAEELPFADETFDAVTFTYLLRYVDDQAATLRELARVLRPGGTLGCLEFHVPEHPLLRAGWWLYTRAGLPLIGALVSPAWRRTGSFLGPNIQAFYRHAPMPEQVWWWQQAGITHIRSRVMSLGAGVVIWGVKGRRVRAGTERSHGR